MIIDGSSQLPDRASFHMNERLNNIKFANVDNLNILKNLDISKAHGHSRITCQNYQFIG